MKKSQPQLEWQFVDEQGGDECWMTIQSPAHAPGRGHAWVIWLVLLTGCIVMTAAAQPDTRPQSLHRPIDSTTQLPFERLTTAFFEFRYPAKEASTIKAISADIDQLYLSVCGDNCLALTGDGGRLVVDVVVGDPLNDNAPTSAQASNRLLLPSVIPAAPPTGPDAAILRHPAAQRSYLLHWLSALAWRSGRRNTAIKPAWTSMLAGLHAQLPCRSDGARRPSALADVGRWTLADTLPLRVRFPTDWSVSHSPNYYPSSHALEHDFSPVTAEALAAYIVNRYGCQVIPRLIEAFRQYYSWGELSPALFGLSAHELESDWHKDLTAPAQ